MRAKPETYCDISTKTFLNLEEAIAYIGFGSKDTFQQWREVGSPYKDRSGKQRKAKLKYHKVGKSIVYRRNDIDDFMHHFRIDQTVIR